MIYLPTEIMRLYRIWNSICYRCNNPENKQYYNYGGRGIYICDEWMDFNKFCEDMYEGSKHGLHLDRIDNNDGYHKSNCRWVTPQTNHRNKRTNTMYKTHVGEICQAELIEKAGFTRKQFRRAIEKYGEDRFLKMFKENSLPKKKVNPDFSDIIGIKFGTLIPTELDANKSTGARYFCLCDCGKKTRVTRFKLLNGLAKYCKSCSKKGEKNPRYRLRKQIHDTT